MRGTGARVPRRRSEANSKRSSGCAPNVVHGTRPRAPMPHTAGDSTSCSGRAPIGARGTGARAPTRPRTDISTSCAGRASRAVHGAATSVLPPQRRTATLRHGSRTKNVATRRPSLDEKKNRSRPTDKKKTLLDSAALVAVRAHKTPFQKGPHTVFFLFSTFSPQKVALFPFFLFFFRCKRRIRVGAFIAFLQRGAFAHLSVWTVWCSFKHFELFRQSCCNRTSTVDHAWIQGGKEKKE